MKNLIKAFLLVVSIASVASAQLVPGPSHPKGPYPAPYPGNPGGGGIVPGPSNPYPSDPYRPPRPPRPSDPYPGNPYPSDPYPSDPYPSDPYPGNGGYEVKRIYLGRSVVNEQIRLRSLAGLDDRYYSDWEVVSVRANVRPNSAGRTVAQLIVDGRVVASQINPGYQISLYPQSQIILDRNASQVRLAISGGTYIDDIEIEVRRSNGGGYNPPPSNPGYGQNIEINVYRSVYGNDEIDLTEYVNLSSYRGYRVQQVIVTGRGTSYSTSYVSLLINGNNMGQLQFSRNSSTTQTVWLNQQPMIGQGADSIVLYTSGDMTVEHVTLVIR